MRLDLGSISKQVYQKRRGEQSAKLRNLAEQLFRIAAEHARDGVEAEGLTDGLLKVAAGELAPEAVSLLAHRQTGSGEPNGFLLRLEGLEVSSRALLGTGGRGPIERLTLSHTELVDLTADLAASRPGDLPPNLFAPYYTDVTLEVLGHRLSVQARRFAGMTESTHGERQRDFDRIYELLAGLNQRVQQRPDAGS